MKLKVGDRVQVTREWWPEGATGVVTSTGRMGFGGGIRGELNGLWRAILGHKPVLVRFDEPQDDEDTYGKYRVAVVPSSCLVPLSE